MSHQSLMYPLTKFNTLLTMILDTINHCPLLSLFYVQIIELPEKDISVLIVGLTARKTLPNFLYSHLTLKIIQLSPCVKSTSGN